MGILTQRCCTLIFNPTLIHLHNNVPGIMAQINQVLASHKANVLGQYLKTNTNIGYVALDIDKKVDRILMAELKKVKNTITLRIS